MIDVFSGMDSKPKIYLCLPATCYIEKGSIKDSVIVHGVIPRIREVAEKNRLEIVDMHAATPECENISLINCIRTGWHLWRWQNVRIGR